VRLKSGEIERILAEYLASSAEPVALTDDTTYAHRLAVCRDCPDLLYGTTCRHCGCLVAVRAKLADRRWPRRRAAMELTWPRSRSSTTPSRSAATSSASLRDLNHAADGGLYAELIQNRSFEYQATEQPTWNALSFWEIAERGNGKSYVAIQDAAHVASEQSPLRRYPRDPSRRRPSD
jgi:hypothetical protein